MIKLPCFYTPEYELDAAPFLIKISFVDELDVLEYEQCLEALEWMLFLMESNRCTTFDPNKTRFGLQCCLTCLSTTIRGFIISAPSTNARAGPGRAATPISLFRVATMCWRR